MGKTKNPPRKPNPPNTPKIFRPLGAHHSIAGGIINAVNRAQELKSSALQIFTKNANQWTGKPISDGDARSFRQGVLDAKLNFVVSHDSYLINLGSAKEDLHAKSVHAFVDELQRAELLGLDGVVTHPGAHGESTPEEALQRVVDGLNASHKLTAGFRAKTLVETTAGQGTSLGWQLDQIGWILKRVAEPDRVGICFDTCHLFAAGYGMTPGEELESTIHAMEEAFDLKNIVLIHTNDSLKPQGSRVDRHAHLGKGHIGLERLRAFVMHPKLAHLPLILETPKETDEAGEDMDDVNLRLLEKFHYTNL
jgi:deoxyribonuclease-4